MEKTRRIRQIIYGIYAVIAVILELVSLLVGGTFKAVMPYYLAIVLGGTVLSFLCDELYYEGRKKSSLRATLENTVFFVTIILMQAISLIVLFNFPKQAIGNVWLISLFMTPALASSILNILFYSLIDDMWDANWLPTFVLCLPIVYLLGVLDTYIFTFVGWNDASAHLLTIIIIDIIFIVKVIKEGVPFYDTEHQRIDYNSYTPSNSTTSSSNTATSSTANSTNSESARTDDYSMTALRNYIERRLFNQKKHYYLREREGIHAKVARYYDYSIDGGDIEIEIKNDYTIWNTLFEHEPDRYTDKEMRIIQGMVEDDNESGPESELASLIDDIMDYIDTLREDYNGYDESFSVSINSEINSVENS